MWGHPKDGVKNGLGELASVRPVILAKDHTDGACSSISKCALTAEENVGIHSLKWRRARGRSPLSSLCVPGSEQGDRVQSMVHTREGSGRCEYCWCRGPVLARGRDVEAGRMLLSVLPLRMGTSLWVVWSRIVTPNRRGTMDVHVAADE